MYDNCGIFQNSDFACRWGATYPDQLRILFVRSLKTRRFESLSVQDLAQLLIVGLLSGALCCTEPTLCCSNCGAADDSIWRSSSLC